MINPESYRKYLESQEFKDFNTKLIRQYILDNHRDMTLEPEYELMREYIRSGNWDSWEGMWQMQKKNDSGYLQGIGESVWKKYELIHSYQCLSKWTKDIHADILNN